MQSIHIIEIELVYTCFVILNQCKYTDSSSTTYSFIYIMSRARPLIVRCWRILYSWETTKDRKTCRSVHSDTLFFVWANRSLFLMLHVLNRSNIYHAIALQWVKPVLFSCYFLRIGYVYSSTMYPCLNPTLSIISVVMDYYLSISSINYLITG